VRRARIAYRPGVAARKPSSPAPDASCRILLLPGKEAFLRQEHAARLRGVLEEAHGRVDVIRFDGAEAEAADVLDECRSMGLLCAHKMVIVDSAEQLVRGEARPLFERYAAAPCEGATLVLRAQTWHKGKLDAGIQKVGRVIKCDLATPSVAASWCQRRCSARHDATIGPAAARSLVERVGTDLSTLDGELSKLALLVGRGGTIEPAHVGELVGASRQEEFWAIQSALVSGSPRSALERLHEILDRASRDANVPVSYSCIDLARKIHTAARMFEAGGSPQQAAGALKLWGPVRDGVIDAARRLGSRRAADLLHAAVDADAAQKSGLGRPERVLECLAIRFTSPPA